MAADAHADPALEVVLPERGELSELPEALLAPGELPELWPTDGGDGAVAHLTMRALTEYFAGGRTVTAHHRSYAYDDLLTIPRCSDHALRSAVARAVERGRVWLTNGPTSVWNEPVPYGALGEAAVLHPPPALIPPQELAGQVLPDERSGGGAPNAAVLTRALSQERGAALPWGLVRDSIRAAVDSRWLQLGSGSGALNCGYDQAGSVLLERPERYVPKPPVAPAPAAATLEGHEMQDLAALMDRLLDQSAGYELRFRSAPRSPPTRPAKYAPPSTASSPKSPPPCEPPRRSSSAPRPARRGLSSPGCRQRYGAYAGHVVGRERVETHPVPGGG